MVEVCNVIKKFGDRVALDDLTLTIGEGETYGLIGPNGSGKTTLIRIIAGLILATSGEVKVMGHRMPAGEIASQLGYMTQQEALYKDLTVRENLQFFATIYGLVGRDREKRIAEVLELVSLTERTDSIVDTLSGGMKQRMSLAVALLHRPRLLLLDEPTVGIDPELRRSFWDYFSELNREGTTLVVSTHSLDEAGRCHRLGLMRLGKLLAEGTAEELKARSGKDDLEETFLHFARGGQAG